MKHPQKYETATGRELRTLVLALQKLVRESPVLSIASPIIENACDHLSAIARVHEVNHDEAKR